MLSNIKTVTKVVAGFGAMLLILAGLGVVGYVMFGKVSTNVTILNDHSLGVVKHAAGVERAAFETIVQEKNFILEEKDEYRLATKKYLADLNSSLDAVDKVAAEFDDADLTNKTKAVREQVKKYGKLYDEGVAALKENTDAAATLVEKVRAVTGEVQAYLAAKQKEYETAKDALSNINRVVSLGWQMRYALQKYKTELDDRWIDAVVKNGKTLEECLDKLKINNPDADELKIIGDTFKAAQVYVDTAIKWRDERKRDEKSPQLAEIDKQNADAGDAVAKAAAEYWGAKGTAIDKMADSVFIAADIAQMALAAQIHTNQFMLYHKPEDWEAIRSNIEELDALYEDINKASLTAEDRLRIERAGEATQEYLIAATTWNENDTSLRETILPKMKKAGETVLVTA